MARSLLSESLRAELPRPCSRRPTAGRIAAYKIMIGTPGHP